MLVRVLPHLNLVTADLYDGLTLVGNCKSSPYHCVEQRENNLFKVDKYSNDKNSLYQQHMTCQPQFESMINQKGYYQYQRNSLFDSDCFFIYSLFCLLFPWTLGYRFNDYKHKLLNYQGKYKVQCFGLYIKQTKRYLFVTHNNKSSMGEAVVHVSLLAFSYYFIRWTCCPIIYSPFKI